MTQLHDGLTATGRPVSDAETELLRQLHDGSLTEIEVAWSDPFGNAAGKRIPAQQFLDRARHGFAFCEAALGWNTDGTVIDGLRLTNWDGGYPDVHAIPVGCRGAPVWVTSSPTSSAPTAHRRCSTRAGCCAACWPGSPHWDTPRGWAWSSSSTCSSRTGRRSSRTSRPTRWRTPIGWTRCSPISTTPSARSPGWRAFRPSTVLARWRPTSSTPRPSTPRTTAPGSSTPPRRSPASTASWPASCPSRSQGSREALHTFTFRCGRTVSRPSRRSTAPRTSWRCSPSAACWSTCRRSPCSARTRSTPTGGTRRTRSPPTR